MGQLFETIQRIERVIERRELQPFRTRGLIALQVGFSLALIEPGTPDDDARLAALRQAARAVLGEPV